MQIFFHVARGHGSFPRGRLLCAPRYPRRPVVSPPILSPVGRDRLLTTAHGGSFYAMVLLTIGRGRRRVEGWCSRWSRSRSAADGDAWRAGARDGVPRDFDRLRTAARGGLGGFCRDRLSIYGTKRSPDRARDWETRAIRLFPNRPRLGNYAKFALSFAKLPKMQTPNAKLFWQIIRI